MDMENNNNVMACICLITCISNHDNYNYDL